MNDPDLDGPVLGGPATSEQRIAEVFVELADTLVDDFDVVDFLQSLAERCVELLEVSAAGLMMADERGRLQLIAGTSTTTRDLELFELQQNEGPCVDTFATGESILNVSIADEDTAARWPAFAAAAAGAGVRSTSALPMRLRGRVIGALNLFSDRHNSLRRTSLALGQAMADVATIGLLNERSVREKTLLSEQLQAALQSRIVIEQAKGVLAARAGIGVEEAFVRLRQHARSRGTALTVVAEAVVNGELHLDGPDGPAGPGPTNRAGIGRPAGAVGAELQPLDLQILRLISAGIPGATVAGLAQVSVSDVTLRLMAIRTRLGVESTAAAVNKARREGLI